METIIEIPLKQWLRRRKLAERILLKLIQAQYNPNQNHIAHKAVEIADEFEKALAASGGLRGSVQDTTG